MTSLRDIYRAPLELLTDLYQLTMAYGYWKSRRSHLGSVFHLFFRKSPFQGGYAIAAGLQDAVEYLESLTFSRDALRYLADLEGNDGKPLFDGEFLEHLGELRFTCDVDAVAEGTVVFPQEPLIRVTGPILQCQIVESALLNLVNFQSLIATKATRIVAAAQGEPVLEFGLRRAQGIDGALMASRAAYLGGCAATSNVLAGMLFGIPVKGTHAHSWVMSFDDEPAAFASYADAMPNNCVFLVDTYDTLEGVRHAIQAGRALRERGYALAGIRLDSGDLAYLSIEARRMLDEAGFTQAAIVASNDLDEHIIASLKTQGAKIAVWGVGTRLVTAHDQPALGGVYKMGAMQDAQGRWEPKLKLSEQAVKTSTPGMLQVRRFHDEHGAVADMIYDELQGPPPTSVLVDPLDSTRRRRMDSRRPSEDLLAPVLRKGKRVRAAESLEHIRSRVQQQLQLFHPGVRRHVHPHAYPVGLEQTLHQRKTDLTIQARELSD